MPYETFMDIGNISATFDSGLKHIRESSENAALHLQFVV
jgi:hypothetical protein